MHQEDRTEALVEQVRGAAASGSPLAIAGGDTKAFYGRLTQAEPLSTLGHSGVTSYEPTELIVTARAGTPLRDVQAALAEHGQALPFEPPHFGDGATLGGTIASGLSGPARPWAGAARDLVLGTRIINGRGEVLRFGGEVMKNVAGYDVSRLMTGALGTLGVLLDVSMKVLPAPTATRTLMFECGADEALAMCSAWAGQPHPITATAHADSTLRVRLAGSALGVDSAAAALGGETEADGDACWSALREHTLPFFDDPTAPLWRLSVAPATPQAPLADALPGRWLLDWNGAQRWLRSDATADVVQAAAAKAGGHATLFRGGDRTRARYFKAPWTQRSHRHAPAVKKQRSIRSTVY